MVGDVGEGASGSFPAVDCSELEAQRARDSSKPKAPESFRHTHAADARKLGLARAEVGGVAAGWVGTAKRIPFLRPPRLKVQYSSWGARACPGDYDRLRPTPASTGPGLWGSSSRFRWTLGSGHPGPGPGDLVSVPAHSALEPLPRPEGLAVLVVVNDW